MLGMDRVEQVMPGDHDQAGGGDRPARQVDEPRQHHHRGANHPDHLRDEDVEMEVEAPTKTYQRELDQYEPVIRGSGESG